MGPTVKRQAELIPANEEPKYPGERMEIVKATPTLLGVLHEAVQRGATVETLVKLYELRERELAREAKQAFDTAFAAFKAEAPKLEKTKSADFGPGKTKYKWAPLNEIADSLGPVLAKHGLSYNWTQQQTADGMITVTCTLKHVGGHFETNTLTGPPDDSGSKNKVQAISSGTSYLRRYTVLGVTGMATADEDTDGVTMNEAADFLTLIRESRTLEELKKNYTDAVQHALRSDVSPKVSGQAIALYKEARQKRESELRA